MGVTDFLAVFGVASSLVLLWAVVPPSVMASAVLGGSVDPFLPNVAAGGVMVGLGALMEWSH